MTLDAKLIDAEELVRNYSVAQLAETAEEYSNVAATAAGWMQCSLANLSAKGVVGNPAAIHAGASPDQSKTWQRNHVVTLAGLCSVFELQGFEVGNRFGGGYYPLWGRAGRAAALRNPGHARFIGATFLKPR